MVIFTSGVVLLTFWDGPLYFWGGPVYFRGGPLYFWGGPSYFWGGPFYCLGWSWLLLGWSLLLFRVVLATFGEVTHSEQTYNSAGGHSKRRGAAGATARALRNNEDAPPCKGLPGSCHGVGFPALEIAEFVG